MLDDSVSLPPTVFLVDNDPEIRTLLNCFLQRAGYRTEIFVNGNAFLMRPAFEGEGCIILDTQLPDMDGLMLQKALAGTGDPLPIIFITSQGDVRTTVQAMKQGASDFLVKPLNHEDLLQAVIDAINNHRRLKQKTAERSKASKLIATLTPREREVMRHVITGRLNKQIAKTLNIREITVKVHRKHVMGKMGVDSVAALVRLVERGKLNV